MDHDNEKQWLLAVASGDERSFRQLVQQYWPQVYGTALRLTRSPEQAKDLSQDIFLKLWNNRQKLSEVDNAGTFIYVCARNLIMDFLSRKVLRTDNLDTLTGHLQADPLPDAQARLEYRELESTLSKAIEHLPAKVKEVFILHRFQGLSHPQIARQLNISVVSSQTYIVRALRSIREYLERHPEGIFTLLALLIAFP
ncbi:RNA polymerase sigma-70 factor [Chitinophaga varians]|uniref:RNA polymerase sigma-70 factor n=1 Tax=Chitinophaga varians TaxID=2202339 RepID=A0A847S0V1_9BACT|nr:RNA polymerase sigma-70 factor [Chitinophaga varians]NLR67025.1 RNA polymerase sigma-70 factor [Chitinophaga varians]